MTRNRELQGLLKWSACNFWVICSTLQGEIGPQEAVPVPSNSNLTQMSLCRSDPTLPRCCLHIIRAAAFRSDKIPKPSDRVSQLRYMTSIACPT